MQKSYFIPVLFVFLFFISCDDKIDTNTNDGDNVSDNYWPEATSLISNGTSSVYPYGMILQKHSNSVSVNTNPSYSSAITEFAGNDGLNNDVRRVERPDYANPDTYEKKIYFDSEAADGGDGTINLPYNTLTGLTKGNLLDDSTAYLLKAGSVFMMSGIQQDYNTLRSKLYFGSYGEGDMPIICNADDFDNPTQTEGAFWLHGDYIAVNELHLVYCTSGTYSTMLKVAGSNITIANSHIEGIKGSEGEYPYYCMKGGADPITIYNTEISYSGNDLFYLSAGNKYTFVSNYFHHVNMGTFYSDTCNPEDRATWRYSTGDIIQLEYGTPKSSYFANNVFDRSSSASKFCFIINGGTSLDSIDGTTIEYNTFINPLKSQYGGAGCYIYSNVIFENNLFLNVDPEGAISGLATYSGYGANYKGNHFVNFNGSEFYNCTINQLGEGHQIFTDIETYQSQVSLQDRKGSSLF